MLCDAARSCVVRPMLCDAMRGTDVVQINETQKVVVAHMARVLAPGGQLRGAASIFYQKHLQGEGAG